MCKCDVFAWFDVGGVIVVLEYSLFHLSEYCMFCKRVYVGCDICLICDA